MSDAGAQTVPPTHPPLRTDDPMVVAQATIEAREQGRSIVNYGLAYAGMGAPPCPGATRLELFGGVIDHWVSDFTVRVHGGATLGELQRHLAPAGQFLPIDADDDLTLGEIAAHNIYGPMRLTYGGMRDLLLGLSFVDGLGREIKVGGRTVKNVAGYDLTRLLVGGMGMFGPITSVTLRTYAIPEHVLAVDLALADPTHLDERLTSCLVTPAAPTTLWLGRSRSDGGGAPAPADPDALETPGQLRWTARVCYFGQPGGAAAQRRALDGWLKQEGAGMVVHAEQATDLPATLADHAWRRAWRRQRSAVVRLIVPPASTGAVVAALDAFDPGPGDANPLNIEALPAHGCVFVGGDLDGRHTRELDALLTRIHQKHGGVHGWVALPADAGAVAPFAPDQPEWAVLARLKAALDPDGVHNPGRLPAMALASPARSSVEADAPS